MVKLFSVKEMQTLEKEANSKGLTYELMMENAGKGIAEKINLAYSHINNKVILAIVGPGNNGGDALVALYYLAQNQWETYAYLVKSRDSEDPLIKRLMENGGKIFNLEEDKKFAVLRKLLNSSAILLDGVLGTGIKLPIKDNIAATLDFVKKVIGESSTKIQVVAVDCPSGVDCETGDIDKSAIPADMTVTMAGLKVGLIKFPAAEFIGEIQYSSIGPIEDLDAYRENKKLVLSREVIQHYLPIRPKGAHKGTFGTALIIAGSVNYTGAVLLSGAAAYRSGAGLVTMAIPAPLHQALAGNLPEATWLLLPHEVGVISADAARVVNQNLERATALLIGPGFGLEETTKDFLARLFTEGTKVKKSDIGFIVDKKEDQKTVSIHQPVVMDADGLKLMSKIPNWFELLPKQSILTPHPGEMSVITGLPTDEIQRNRVDVSSKYAREWGHIIVLKGAFTIITAPDGQQAVVPIATSALAKAGTGDVLAGLIVGLRAQGIDAFEAACTGAWIHATAGLLAERSLGSASVMASDVLNAIPAVISDLYVK